MLPRVGVGEPRAESLGREVEHHVAEATPLGCFPVELDADLPDGAQVEVTLAVGRDGVLRLELRDPATDKRRAVTLADAEGLYADDELEARRRWLAGVSVE